MGNEFLRPKEVARIFGVTIKTVYRWIHQKKIKTTMTPGGQFLIKREEVRRFLDKKL